MSCPPKQRGRRRSAAFASGARSSGESPPEELALKASKSFEFQGDLPEAAAPSARRLARSFVAEDRRRCKAHPKIALGQNEAAIKLVKRAAKTLERRAAELELEGKKEQKLMKRATQKLQLRAAELELEQKRKKERKAVSSSRNKSSDKEAEVRKQEIKALQRWSTGFEYESVTRTEGSEKANSSSSPRRQSLKRHFSLGQVALVHQMVRSSSPKDDLINIARLQVGDGAWIRRSDDVFTYAVLKARETGPAEANLKFTVNERGCTKTFPFSHWLKCIKMVEEEVTVAELEIEAEEKEIDLMLSDCPEKGGKDGHVLDTSMKSFASVPTVGSADDMPSKKPSKRHNRKDELTSSLFSATSVGAVADLPDDGSSQASSQEMKMIVSRLQDASRPLVKNEAAPDNDKVHRVSLESFAQEEDETSIVSDPSYPADCEEDRARPGNEAAEAATARGVLKRAASLSVPRETEGPAKTRGDNSTKRRSSRRRMKHRVSWSADVDKIKDEIRFDVDGSYGSLLHSTILPVDARVVVRAVVDAEQLVLPPHYKVSEGPSKTKLGDPSMGKTVRKRFGRRESFHSALRSIHRRSPSGRLSVAVNIN